MFSSLFQSISNSLGLGQANDPNDLSLTRRKFAGAGYGPTIEEDDQDNENLYGTIRRFQKDKGLQVDGVMNPFGETETALHDSLSEQLKRINPLRDEEEKEKPAYRTPGIIPERERPEPNQSIFKSLPMLILKDRVGNNKPNDHEDMTGIQEQLAGLGYLPERHAREPDLYITKPIEDAIRRFQMDNNLKSDGWAGPKGETEKTLNKQVSDLITSSKAQINKVQFIAKEKIKSATEAIFPDAARNFEHYQNEKGKPQILNGQKIRDENPFIQQAEKENIDRLVGSLSDPNKPYAQQLAKMKIGETLELTNAKGGTGDYIDRDFKKFYDKRELNEIFSSKDLNDLSKNVKQSRSLDDLLAYGGTKLRSVGQFKAKRTKDGYEIEGDLSHLWQDKYDFEGAYRPAADQWERQGAKPYQSATAWENKIRVRLPLASDGKYKPMVEVVKRGE